MERKKTASFTREYFWRESRSIKIIRFLGFSQAWARARTLLLYLVVSFLVEKSQLFSYRWCKKIFSARSNYDAFDGAHSVLHALGLNFLFFVGPLLVLYVALREGQSFFFSPTISTRWCTNRNSTHRKWNLEKEEECWRQKKKKKKSGIEKWKRRRKKNGR